MKAFLGGTDVFTLLPSFFSKSFVQPHLRHGLPWAFDMHHVKMWAAHTNRKPLAVAQPCPVTLHILSLSQPPINKHFLWALNQMDM